MSSSDDRTSPLAGRWALVTGASRGVGYQLALGLAEHGCRLLLHARRSEHLDEIAARLGDAAVVHRLEAELSEPAAVEALIERVRELCGAPDVIFNNAAIMTPWTEAHRTPSADYRTSFEVNVIAPVAICDAFIGPMKARGSGRIINVTSGIENIPELLPYSMSKAALDRYVRDVSGSLEGTGVVMSRLDPGWLRTDLGGEQAPNDVESVLPGGLVPALLEDDAKSGQLFRAQDFTASS